MRQEELRPALYHRMRRFPVMSHPDRTFARANGVAWPAAAVFGFIVLVLALRYLILQST